jgi:hypothetical protein
LLLHSICEPSDSDLDQVSRKLVEQLKAYSDHEIIRDAIVSILSKLVYHSELFLAVSCISLNFSLARLSDTIVESIQGIIIRLDCTPSMVSIIEGLAAHGKYSHTINSGITNVLIIL